MNEDKYCNIGLVSLAFGCEWTIKICNLKSKISYNYLWVIINS